MEKKQNPTSLKLKFALGARPRTAMAVHQRMFLCFGLGFLLGLFATALGVGASGHASVRSSHAENRDLLVGPTSDSAGVFRGPERRESQRRHRRPSLEGLQFWPHVQLQCSLAAPALQTGRVRAVGTTRDGGAVLTRAL